MRMLIDDDRGGPAGVDSLHIEVAPPPAESRLVAECIAHELREQVINPGLRREAGCCPAVPLAVLGCRPAWAALVSRGRESAPLPSASAAWCHLNASSADP